MKGAEAAFLMLPPFFAPAPGFPEARAVPREQWTAVLSAQGLPPRAIEPMTEMVDSYNSGWIDFGVPGTEPVAGTLTPAQLFARARTARGGH